MRIHVMYFYAMSMQQVLPASLVYTFIALVRFLAGVHTNVALEVTGLSKS